MANRILFSIYIDIAEDELDNPGWFMPNGEQVETDKSKNTKNALSEWYNDIVANHSQYAQLCNADYVVHENDEQWQEYKKDFNEKYPQISTYDIINFYKHWLMIEYADKYDEICYADFDVVFNTNEDIFEAHDIHNKFACAESNVEALHGKNLRPEVYNMCIRNPASKYWNAYALLLDSGYTTLEADTDVFNTGIMIASSEQVKKFDYFGDLDNVLDDMEYLKNDTSVFHPNVVRAFNYDNETIFSFKRILNEVVIDYINEDWHQRVHDNMPYVEDAKVFHVINKRFDWFEGILRKSR